MKRFEWAGESVNVVNVVNVVNAAIINGKKAHANVSKCFKINS